MRKKLACLGILLACLLCSACGPKEAANEAGNTVSVSNYSFVGEAQQVEVKQEPQRVLVCGNSGVKTLLALGAGDKIVAAVLTEADEAAALQQQLPQAKVYTQPLQLEAATMLQPDFILGWRRFFADNQLGDTKAWIAKGVPAYIQDASGPIPAKGRFPACTIASEKRFISNMGKIMHRQKRAEQLLQQIDGELQVVKPIRAQKVLFVEFLGGNIEVFGDDLLCGDIVKRYGSSLVSYSAPFISQEELMELQAEKIFVIYHGGAAEGQAALAKLQNPLYKHLPAVREGKIYALPYNAIVAPGAELLNTLQYIRRCLET
jgi:iron complex transport system substrate-binding protein